MKPQIYRSARGQEFITLFRQLEEFGIKQTGIAEKLGKTRSAINQYISGATNPTEGSLTILRNWLADLKGQSVISEPEMTSQRLHEILRKLEESDPPGFLAAQTAIEALYRRTQSGRPKANSTLPAGVKAAVEKVAERLSREDPK